MLDGIGLYYFVFEVFDNLIDEVLVGYCNDIYVMIYVDNLIFVVDNGCGILIDVKMNDKYELKCSVVEIVMIELYVGGKFDQNSYKVLGGLYGVGVLCVNVLLSWLCFIVCCDGKKCFMEFYCGVVQDCVIEMVDGVEVLLMFVIGDIENCGIEVYFMVDLIIFGMVEYYYDIFVKWMCEFLFLNNGVWICFIDLCLGKEDDFVFVGGVKGFVEFINKMKSMLYLMVFFVNGEKDGVGVEVVMQWNDSYNENVLCFMNNILQCDGGMYLIGLWVVMMCVINKYIIDNEIVKKVKVEMIGDDMCEGLLCVFFVKVLELKFSLQMKDKLVFFEVCVLVEEVVVKVLEEFLFEMLIDVKIICGKIVEVVWVCDVVWKVCEMMCCKGVFDGVGLLGKFVDCQEKDLVKCEIYIVEGDLVGGLVK